MKALVIGLGWLGLPLADHLIAEGYSVSGTTRTIDKQQALKSQGYKAHLFDLYSSKIQQQLTPSVIESSRVVINIAPGRKNFHRENYQNAIQRLIEHLVNSGAQHITFVSTTSVFGQTSSTLNEQSEPSPLTESGKAHTWVESLLLQQTIKHASVLRLAGLIGPNSDGKLRHPVYSLGKKSEIENGQQRVNLVHQSDAIRLISAIMNKEKSQGVFHGCATEHPSREEYYQWAAERLNLGKLNFVNKQDASIAQNGKIIDSSHTLQDLGISLKYPSPYDMLDS